MAGRERGEEGPDPLCLHLLTGRSHQGYAADCIQPRKSVRERGRERRGGTCDRNISLEAATSPLWQRFRDESKEKAQQHKTHHLAARYRNSKESEGKRSSSSSAISQKFSCRR
jgi:hypothetical protein